MLIKFDILYIQNTILKLSFKELKKLSIWHSLYFLYNYFFYKVFVWIVLSIVLSVILLVEHACTNKNLYKINFFFCLDDFLKTS